MASENCIGDLRKIDDCVIHHLCTGQVILNIAGACKELIENSVDAGATSIEIRLKECGVECLEVTDNGCGIKLEHFDAIAKAHWTSKLKLFTDLTSITTFGFRGEALSALCALSNVVITTRHELDNIGHKLGFDHSGAIVRRIPCPRQVGTTVTVSNLFVTLPVRHKDFAKNYKREFQRLIHTVHAHCLVSKRVRFRCTNSVNGKQSEIVATQGANCLKQNIRSVFGAKQLQSLLEFKLSLPDKQTCESLGIDKDAITSFSQIHFNIEGFISSCKHGEGRSTTDRQFLYVNQRPCEFDKVGKIVNEVYHQFNKNQYPVVVLNFVLSQDSIDVNVTPDKRQIYVERDKLIAATVKGSLLEMYHTECGSESGCYSSVNGSGIVSSSLLFASTPNDKCETSSTVLFGAINDESHSKNSTVNHARNSVALSATENNPYVPVMGRRTEQRSYSLDLPPSLIEEALLAKKQSKIDSFLVIGNNQRCPPRPASADSWRDTSSSQTFKITPVKETSLAMSPPLGIINSSGKRPASVDRNDLRRQRAGCSSDVFSPQKLSGAKRKLNLDGSSTSDISSVSDLRVPVTDFFESANERGFSKKICADDVLEVQPEVLEVDVRTGAKFGRKAWTVSCSFDKLCQTLYDLKGKHSNTTGTNAVDAMLCSSQDENDILSTLPSEACIPPSSFLSGVALEDNCDPQGFTAKIVPTDNVLANEELQRCLRKEQFKTMSVIGQFNKSFIVAKLHDDLFIVDQHASDEKYKFEELLNRELVECQRLLMPKHLDLTPISEIVLMDNLDLFRKNGFEFVFDMNAEPGQRVFLAGMPVCFGINFEKMVSDCKCRSFWFRSSLRVSEDSRTAMEALTREVNCISGHLDYCLSATVA